jgi:hypothetical protein
VLCFVGKEVSEPLFASQIDIHHKLKRGSDADLLYFNPNTEKSNNIRNDQCCGALLYGMR